MTNSFAETLQRLLDERNMSQSELARRTGITQSSISDYIKGRYEPKQDKVDAIATALRVSPSALAGINSGNVIGSIASNPNIEDVVSNMTRLNYEGQRKTVDYTRDLVQSKQYEINDQSASPYTDYTIGAAAAGQGVHYGDEIRNYRTFMVTEVPEHDISIDVTGNSMWPTIYDGDVVFVRKAYDKHDGGIYVLDIDGETVIKRVYFDDDSIRLVSDNPEFDDRTVSGYELEQTRVVGEVVGWETPVK